MQLIGERRSSKARKAAKQVKQAAAGAAKKVGGKLAKAGRGAKNLAKRGFRPIGLVMNARRGVLSFGYAGEMLGIGGGLGYLSGLAEDYGIKNRYLYSAAAFLMGLAVLVMKPRSDKWKMRYITGGSALMGISFYIAGNEIQRRRRLAAAPAAGAN